MKTHDKVAELLKASDVLGSMGFRDMIWYIAKGVNHHDLIVISKSSWQIPCSDAACGYDSVLLHFEYERPGFLLLHCELWPRKGSESNFPRDRIQPLLDCKGGIAELIRDTAFENAWASSVGWVASAKDLREPKNLQVGKFSLGAASDEPGFVAKAIERIVKVVVPSIDPIMSDQ